MNNIPNIEKLLHSLKEEAIPSDAFRKNARIRVLNTVTSPHPLRPSWYQRPRVLGYTFGTALATVLLSAGTVYAAQSSLPNSKLYPIKVLSEQVALTLSPTESLKTTVAQTIISRRITEVEEVQKNGDTKAVQQSISHLNEDVTSIQKRKDVSRGEIEQTLTEHKDFLNTVNEDRPSPTPASPDASSPRVEAGQGGPTSTQPEIKLPRVEGTTTTHESN